MIYNTSLSLSLGSGGSSTTPDSIQIHQQYNKRKLSTHDQELLDINNLPSLTLGMSSSSVSVAVSSFSNSSVKRELREASLEEVVEEFDTNKVKFSQTLDVDQDQDQDDDQFGTRKKLRLSKEQSAVLEDSFKEHSTLNSKQKRDLATRLRLRPRQVEVWFQNRRARTKLKQTEVDCEILRKCFEDLKDENRRLNKELQELKSLKMAAPFHLQLSAATLSMCPPCERTYGNGDNSTKISFAIGDQKPHLYGPFTNPSAALLS